MRPLGAVLLALAVLTGCSGGTSLQPWAPGDPVVSAPTRQPPIVGVTYHPTWSEMTDARRAHVLDQLVQAGVTWLRVDVSWKEFQPDSSADFDDDAIAAFDKRLAEIGSRGFKILLMFYWAPVWASGSEAMNGRPSAPAFAQATGWLVDRWGEQLSALEVWNEPDTERFWDPRPERTRVTDFTDMVIQASRAAKSVRPDLPVIVGGTSRIDTQWWAQVLSSPDLAASVDAIAVHPYTVPSDLSPRAPDTGKPWRVKYLRSLVELLDRAEPVHHADMDHGIRLVHRPDLATGRVRACRERVSAGNVPDAGSGGVRPLSPGAGGLLVHRRGPSDT